MSECHQAFLKQYPWLTKYEDFNTWLFSQELICTVFRQGWVAGYRNR